MVNKLVSAAAPACKFDELVLVNIDDAAFCFSGNS